ncbi:MAG: tRNA (5-methylaminomethyl-2-thiouridine)(34)-methyltransferase MnmD [Roseibium sp.]
MTDEAQRKIDTAFSCAPKLEWLAGDVPRAEEFDDTYFSKAGGFAETQHVFLAGNTLPERFEGRDSFTIAEFGFGTGLNFLATLLALRKLTALPKLTFISFELYPMSAEQLSRALAAFPEVASVAEELVGDWAPAEGWNSMSIAGVELMLGVGDARKLITDLKIGKTGAANSSQSINPVDAWYLDGFSPAKNPELWDAELLHDAADLTVENGTLATYTSAGWVRRNLQAAGFTVQKVKGFSGKREMVVGRKTDPNSLVP